ncbi:MAG: hypothetical protein R2724_18745 [Bryobacterales bacterium]
MNLLRRSLLGLLLTAALGLGANPVERLQQRIDAGEVRLEYTAPRGYLDSLLEAFGIDPQTQTLVFSKTSAQFRLISPRSPRAVYFNDDVYVGWVRGGPILEISTADTERGAAFYVLLQDANAKPKLMRDVGGQCLQCHESGRTGRVPGHLTRSLYVAPDGQPELRLGSVDVDQTTPLSERFGGWFVTDAVFDHRGNQLLTSPNDTETTTPVWFEDVPRNEEYLRRDSSVLAHLLLAHQTQTHNRIARAGLEARKAIEYRDEMRRLFGGPSEETEASVKRRIAAPAEELLDYLLFSKEAALPPGRYADTPFARSFSQRGPLYALDLRTRLLRVPLSYLIASESFDALPPETLDYLRGRFVQILEGEDKSGRFAHLTPADREAVRRLLQAEKPGFLPAN